MLADAMAALLRYARARRPGIGPAPRRVEIGAAVLYLGDCTEIVPALAGVDAVLTDPPPGFSPTWFACGPDGLRERFAAGRQPHELQQQLLGLLQARPGWATVLDPFMGERCAAGVAALRAGRRFIGIEIRQDAFERACRVIAQEV
jgi:DNA modification methylase